MNQNVLVLKISLIQMYRKGEKEFNTTLSLDYIFSRYEKL